MINIADLLKSAEKTNINQNYKTAKVCQDILLKLMSESRFVNNITIKGGVVMRQLSNNARRSTIDIDIDFVKFPLTNYGIRKFINDLNNKEGIKLSIIGPIKNLKHKDYEGKHINLRFTDSFGSKPIALQIDFGVHKYMELDQIECVFNVGCSEKGVTLFINEKEQIFVEKLKTLLRFKVRTTRYKDIFDLYYLIPTLDDNKTIRNIRLLIFEDRSLNITCIDDILFKLTYIFSSIRFKRGLMLSESNWLNLPIDEVLLTIITFIESIK